MTKPGSLPAEISISTGRMKNHSPGLLFDPVVERCMDDFAPLRRNFLSIKRSASVIRQLFFRRRNGRISARGALAMGFISVANLVLNMGPY